ncbi:uncharacterized protein LOC111687113 [Lucilia cuprina]|uniref:uncharacterized protein LOC111687113 n=1 Tax=Lucilia cuprina TaxID=7375 RepID=UPI001F05101C|nr:uncharacterized protein LOC111687113 [Lucilia cuprina]
MKTKTEIINPNENIEIPSWIKLDYFEDILAKDEPEAKDVKNFIPIAAVPPGENFTSIMLRIHMDLIMKDDSIKHKTYILKTMIDDDKGGDIVNKLSLFPKEMAMYQKYLPAFEELYKTVGWHIKLSPKCLFSEKKNGRYNFVFEDLKENNYVNIDRLKGCDMKHMKSILRRLAELHAVSAVYEERNGEYPNDFQIGFVDLEAGADYQKSMFKTRKESYKKAMQLWGLKDVEKYLKEFPSCEQYWKCCLKTLDQKTNKFNVLNHGDFWSSNIMFNYLPNGDLNELIFLDYQFCKWGSPVEDLLLFITISAAKDIRIKEFDNFIYLYHERLVECLKVLGFRKPLPKLRDLLKDIFDENNSFHAFFACINHLPILMLPNDKDSSIHNFCRPDDFGEQFRMKALTNPSYVEAMKDLYPFFFRRGLFNFSDYD